MNRLATRDPNDVRKTVDHPDIASLQRLAKIMQLSSYSTVFSGIDSPGTAFAQLRVALESILDISIHDPEHLHAVEAFIYLECSLEVLLKPICSNVWGMNQQSTL